MWWWQAKKKEVIDHSSLMMIDNLTLFPSPLQAVQKGPWCLLNSKIQSWEATERNRNCFRHPVLYPQNRGHHHPQWKGLQGIHLDHFVVQLHASIACSSERLVCNILYSSLEIILISLDNQTFLLGSSLWAHATLLHPRFPGFLSENLLCNSDIILSDGIFPFCSDRIHLQYTLSLFEVPQEILRILNSILGSGF